MGAKGQDWCVIVCCQDDNGRTYYVARFASSQSGIQELVHHESGEYTYSKHRRGALQFPWNFSQEMTWKVQALNKQERSLEGDE